MSRLFAPYLDLLEHTLKQHSMSDIQITEYANATVSLLDIGILTIVPNAPTQSGLILSAGVHGNETAPIELLNNLVTSLLKGECTEVRRPILIIFGHPEAMRLGQRFIDFNMNRLFMGAHAKPEYHASVDAQRAQKIEHIVSEFCTEHAVSEHYDLHTAIRASEYERFALAPLVDEPLTPDAKAQSELFMSQAGIQALVQQNTYASTFCSHTGNLFKLESYTLELGKVHTFGNNELARYEDTSAALFALISGRFDNSGSRESSETTSVEHQASIDRFEVTHEIIVPDASFKLHISSDQANFGCFKVGECIWQSQAHEYRVQHEKEYIIFPNPDVPPGQRAGLMLVKANALSN